MNKINIKTWAELFFVLLSGLTYPDTVTPENGENLSVKAK